MPTRIKKYKIGRRLGPGVYEKCQSQKFMLSQARHQKNAKRMTKRPTDYGLQLMDKQRVRFMYGVREKQFTNYIAEAMRSATKDVMPATRLFQLLERRLDNVIFRMGIGHTRQLTRQMVSHGHFLVNGKKTTVPSYRVKEGDVITIRPGSKDSALFADLDKKMKNYPFPGWLVWDNQKKEGHVKGVPTDPDSFLNFQGVIEFYSR